MRTIDVMIAVGSVATAAAFVGVYTWFVLQSKDDDSADIGYGGSCDNGSAVELQQATDCATAFDGAVPVGNVCPVNACNNGSQFQRIVADASICVAPEKYGVPSVNIGPLSPSNCALIGGTSTQNGECFVHTCRCLKDHADTLIKPLGHCLIGDYAMTASIPHIPNPTCRELGGLPESNEHCQLSLCHHKKKTS